MISTPNPTPKIQKVLKTKMEFLTQATDEMRMLHEEIEEFDRQADELKRKREVLIAATAEISKLKALRTRDVAENEKTYAELKQEFEGASSPNTRNTCFRSLTPLLQNLMKNCKPLQLRLKKS